MLGQFVIDRVDRRTASRRVRLWCSPARSPPSSAVRAAWREGYQRVACNSCKGCIGTPSGPTGKSDTVIKSVSSGLPVAGDRIKVSGTGFRCHRAKNEPAPAWGVRPLLRARPGAVPPVAPAPLAPTRLRRRAVGPPCSNGGQTTAPQYGCINIPSPRPAQCHGGQQLRDG